jgi:hypothetical protein
MKITSAQKQFVSAISTINQTIYLLDSVPTNHNVTVLTHVIQTPLKYFIAMLLGSKYHVPIELFIRAQAYLTEPHTLPSEYQTFRDIYHDADLWLRRQLTAERLVLTDAAGLPPQLGALLQWVRAIRNKYPQRSLYVLGDSVYLYSLPGERKGVTKGKLAYVQQIAAEQRCDIVLYPYEFHPSAEPSDTDETPFANQT